MNGVYKIIAKFLANRFSKFVNKIILKPQNVFAKGRTILDYVLIANECLDYRLSSREPRLHCK